MSVNSLEFKHKQDCKIVKFKRLLKLAALLMATNRFLTEFVIKSFNIILFIRMAVNLDTFA